MQNINDQIGQLFLIGFQGAEPSEAFLEFIGKNNIGGVILFAENCTSTQLLKNNIKKIKKASAYFQPFIAIDQEGGRVSRIKGAPAEIAAAKAYGESLGMDRFTDEYSRSTYFMESLGINLNLAPVCDLFLHEENSCLKDRCFGRTPEEVIPFITKAVEISKKNNVLSCLKHFPGLGDSNIDPHIDTPEGFYDQILWSHREKLVFEAGVRAGADMIMTTHLILPEIDNKIVTGSTKIIEELIRTQLDFDSVVISDDLTMHGADTLGTYGERTVEAFNAGHDILLFGQNFEAASEAYTCFLSKCLNNEIASEKISRSLERITSLKLKIAKSVLL